LCAQQGVPDFSPTFSSEARLVLLSFNVQRGAYFAPDLKPEDVLLLEDGKPRAFTVFEGPGKGRRPPLELVLLFDTTTLPPAESKLKVRDTYWDRDSTYSFAAQWGEKDSRAILEKDGADVRVSIYRYDHQQLQNLCRSTKDPEILSRAIQRLPEAIPASEAIPLTLPRGRIAHAGANTKSGRLYWPLSWTLEAVIRALNDSTSGHEAAMRALIVFSERVGPTTTREEDAADAALALGVPLYPVVIGFEEYLLHPFGTMSVRSDFFTQHSDVMIQIPRPDQQPSSSGPAAANPLEDSTRRYVNGSTVPMLRFGRLGPLTGGAALFPSQINAAAITDILGVIRDKSLSQYIVGFVPQSSDRPRSHRLKIGIKAAADGKLVGGERTAVY
jgi:hypothetical protein